MTIPWLRFSARVAHFLGVTLPEEADLEVGVEAWGRGDYDTAVREFLPLAEQGDSLAWRSWPQPTAPVHHSSRRVQKYRSE